jgi:uncharacterized repeat protein (TIGR03943 family)
VRREATNVLLVLVGGALLKITLDGTYLRYVKPSARPWVLAAGAVVIALALVANIGDVVHTDDQAGEHGHQHGEGRWVWLLTLPVLAIFLVAPPALGADSVLRSSGRIAPGVVQRGVSAFAPLPRGAVVPVTMGDLITRSVWDSAHSLTGRTVALTGFVVHQDGTDYVARLVITCCAADATPMKIALTGGQARALPDDQWITVEGTVVPGSATEADEYTPTLTVTTLGTTTAPADPYEY